MKRTPENQVDFLVKTLLNKEPKIEISLKPVEFLSLSEALQIDKPSSNSNLVNLSDFLEKSFDFPNFSREDSYFPQKNEKEQEHVFYELMTLAQGKFKITLIFNMKTLDEFVIKEYDPMESRFSVEKDPLERELLVNHYLNENLTNEYQKNFFSFALNPKKISLIPRSLIVMRKGLMDLERFYELSDKPSLDTFLFVTNTVLSCVRALHDLWVIHGDIRMKNFVFFEDEDEKIRLKLIDFGNSTTGHNALFFEKQKIEMRKILMILLKICEKNPVFTPNFFEWKEYLTALGCKEKHQIQDISEFYNFYDLFSVNQDSLSAYSEQIFKENPILDRFSMIGFDVSAHEKLKFSDNLCVLGLLFENPLQRNRKIGEEFLMMGKLGKYVKTVHNQMNLLVTEYWISFRNCKRSYLETTRLGQSSDSIASLIASLQELYQENYSIFSKKILSSEAIYAKFYSLLLEIKSLISYFQAEPADQSFKRIGKKKKNKVASFHSRIYENFWAFIENRPWQNDFKDLLSEIKIRDLKVFFNP